MTPPEGVAEIAAELDAARDDRPADPDRSAGAGDVEALRDAVADADEPADEPDGVRWVDVLRRAPSGSIETASAREIFSPDAGGWDRVALVLEDVLAGEGLPNWAHLLIAPVEIAIANGSLDLPAALDPDPDRERDREPEVSGHE